MKIDIKCDCCENNEFIPNDLESIEKVVDEIVLAKARRANDGTYSA